MVAALLLLLASQVVFLWEIVRLNRVGFSQDRDFVLWLGARMAVVAVLTIWLAIGAHWAYWTTVAAAVAQAAYLATDGARRPLPYALVIVVLAAAVAARPAFRRDREPAAGF